MVLVMDCFCDELAIENPQTFLCEKRDYGSTRWKIGMVRGICVALGNVYLNVCSNRIEWMPESFARGRLWKKDTRFPRDWGCLPNWTGTIEIECVLVKQELMVCAPGGVVERVCAKQMRMWYVFAQSKCDHGCAEQT